MIKVPRRFLTTVPKPEKVEKKRWLLKKGCMGKPVTVSPDGRVVDGYITLLVYLEAGYKDIPCKTINYYAVEGIPLLDVPELVALMEGKLRIEDLSVNLDTIAYPSEFSMLKAQAEKQKNKCYICGRTMEAKINRDVVRSCNEHTLDHIFPRALGGVSSYENLAACCHRCNQLKGQLIFTDDLREIIVRQRLAEDAVERGAAEWIWC